MKPRQVLLPFPILDAAATRDNLVLGQSNRLAWDAIRQLLGQPCGLLTLHGEEATGKTHLLRAAIQDLPHARLLDLRLLRGHWTEAREEDLALFLQRQETLDPVAIDHLELLEDAPALQEAILYLINSLRGRARLLAAGRFSPAAMPWLRSDLSSRLLWYPVVPVLPAGEEELPAILAKLARDRQIHLPRELAEFLLRRLPRHLPAFARALDLLDRASLLGSRPLSIPLAKEVLGV